MLLLVYANLIRSALIIAIIYFIFKRKFKLILPILIAFTLTFLLIFIDWIFNIKMDWLGETLYYTILFMTIYLGSTLKFYDKYAWWDMLIHFLSSISFVSFGVAISSKIADLPKFSILFFCLTFSVTLHVIWEIAEYIVDCIQHTNHQRWQKIHDSQNHKSPKAIQPAGLVDTMNDTLICIAGTIISCAIWWFVL